MKKKILIAAIVIAVLAVAILLIRSGSSEEPPVDDGQPITVNIEPDTTKKQKDIPLKRKITVTLPLDAIDEEYRDNLDAYAEAKGYDSIKLLDDGQVKIKMREFSYRLLLTNYGMETINGIAYALDSETYPYFIDLAKYNDDFSYIVVTVNKKGYKKAENKEDLFNHIALFCLGYQEYDIDSEGRCEIVVCEEGTNILIESKEFTKEDLEQ